MSNAGEGRESDELVAVAEIVSTNCHIALLACCKLVAQSNGVFGELVGTEDPANVQWG